VPVVDGLLFFERWVFPVFFSLFGAPQRNPAFFQRSFCVLGLNLHGFRILMSRRLSFHVVRPLPFCPSPGKIFFHPFSLHQPLLSSQLDKRSWIGTFFNRVPPTTLSPLSDYECAAPSFFFPRPLVSLPVGLVAMDDSSVSQHLSFFPIRGFSASQNCANNCFLLVFWFFRPLERCALRFPFSIVKTYWSGHSLLLFF